MKTSPIIYFDLDGTLNFWREGATIEEINKKGFFSGALPIPEMCALAGTLVMEGFDVRICTKGLTDEDPRKEAQVREEKLLWVSTFLPELEGKVSFCPVNMDKDTFLQPRLCDVLVSDRTTQELESWSGVGVKVLNGVSGATGRWKGHAICAFSDFPEMMDVLLAAIKKGQRKYEIGPNPQKKGGVA